MKKVCLSLGLASALLLTGCASYQSNSLSALDPAYVRNYPEVDGVMVGCKAYTKDDCYTYLDRDVLAKGYQPIQLTFQNTTDKHYIFSTNEISVPCASPEEVADSVHTSTAGRVIGYTLIGFVIPAVVDGVKSSNANAALDKDFYHKAREHFVIGPKDFVKTLIFVPKAQFAPVFDVSLLEEETGQHKTIGLSVVR